MTGNELARLNGMPRSGTQGRRGRPRKDPAQQSASLIDWTEPEQNMHVLDWRERAHEFGLVPGDDSDHEPVVVTPPHLLIEEEEPEAFEPHDFRAVEDVEN